MGRERGLEIEPCAAAEGHPGSLALHDEPDGDALHPAGRARAGHPAPEHRRRLPTDEAVEDPSGLLRLDELHVELPRVGERIADRLGRDLVEDHPPDGYLRLQHLDDVPGDRLTLAILVGREDDLIDALQRTPQLGDDLLLRWGDDVVRVEVVLRVDPHETAVALAELLRELLPLLREVADVTDARLEQELARRADLRAAVEKARDGLRLCG